jgi:hypothetical protein
VAKGPVLLLQLDRPKVEDTSAMGPSIDSSIFNADHVSGYLYYYLISEPQEKYT